jgi:response regulator RpfG family c-di-GMP phosphodiesterase
MIDNDDELLFLEDDDDSIKENKNKWKVMIVDDEREVHHVTKMVLSEFSFEGKSLEIISAYSAKEAIELIQENPDTALILLDVVMEEDYSGLKVVDFIRKTLKNPIVRIILRTGQPGQAPEEKIILEYDINDYKEKTELTVQKLYTAIISSLRSYRDLTTIERSKKGLERIIESSANIFEQQSMKEFATGVLEQIISILGLSRNALYCRTSGFAAVKDLNSEFYMIAATGDFHDSIDKEMRSAVSPRVFHLIEEAYKGKKSLFYESEFTIYFENKNGVENVIYMEGVSNIDKWDIDLIEIFSNNVSIAFDNLYLNREIIDTQKEIIFTLGEIVEGRSKETGNHVKRVAEYCKVLALANGMAEEDAELFRLAAPMHDIGKLAIPDKILMKPGKLDPEEFEIIKAHTTIGHDMLKKSNRNIMKAAIIIALEHHEKYDGTGYPNGLLGEEIHIYGRITALADVFDALGSDRVYKKAWPLEDILAYIRSESGHHFDPKLVDILFENLDEILKIRDKFTD